jgi:hypothetical protein
MKKYPDLGPKFKPLVIESTGGWHGYSMDYLKTMAGHIASRSDKSILTVLNDLLSTYILTTYIYVLLHYKGTKVLC